MDTAPGVQPPTAADFPGCKPVRLPREELDDCEIRLEYWDTVSETAWICDPVSSYHEGPTQRLGRLAERIAAVRGGPVECLGSTDLTERDAHGKARLIMQADERTEFARALLAARGIVVSPGFPGVPGFAELPRPAIVAAATACVSEADFRKRLRSR